jgi:hypothetical protein
MHEDFFLPNWSGVYGREDILPAMWEYFEILGSPETTTNYLGKSVMMSLQQSACSDLNDIIARENFCFENWKEGDSAWILDCSCSSALVPPLVSWLLRWNIGNMVKCILLSISS